MTCPTLINILKGAILLEYKGKNLYESAVKTAKNDEVKVLFQRLVDEEKSHIDLLKKQYSLVLKDQDFNNEDLKKVKSTFSDAIIDKNIIDKVSGAGYEAAVIAAALELEKNAVRYYTVLASRSFVKEEKEFFQWMAKWETSHMSLLAKIDSEIKEKIWFDSQFWPLD